MEQENIRILFEWCQGNHHKERYDIPPAPLNKTSDGVCTCHRGLADKSSVRRQKLRFRPHPDPDQQPESELPELPELPVRGATTLTNKYGEIGDIMMQVWDSAGPANTDKTQYKKRKTLAWFYIGTTLIDSCIKNIS